VGPCRQEQPVPRETKRSSGGRWSRPRRWSVKGQTSSLHVEAPSAYDSPRRCFGFAVNAGWVGVVDERSAEEVGEASEDRHGDHAAHAASRSRRPRVHARPRQPAGRPLRPRHPPPHILRKVLFPYLDLGAFVAKALEDSRASGMVFLGMSFIIGMMIFSATQLLE
jgi:hypothetical protein